MTQFCDRPITRAQLDVLCCPTFLARRNFFRSILLLPVLSSLDSEGILVSISGHVTETKDRGGMRWRVSGHAPSSPLPSPP